ncbi:MAG: RdgB/HAM1 family non-canonical purine NTP pyrophosphatase [Gammaproteobacteria bacterium AqS3]|nr:RdgB/HAM1 family non-canonical purine NTP pyrophosphatase [Gammaproteobacteria bacterium AqS3]
MRVVLASGNAGKLRELSALLGPLGYECLPLSEFSDRQADETGQSFLENALIKAAAAAEASGLPAIADDSGLAVDALDGAPGIYSARFAGADATGEQNNQLLLEKMRGVGQGGRGAHFHCSVALASPNPDREPLIAEAQWHGEILEAPQGAGGFGYDPVFADQAGRCAAELPAEVKNRISHRGQALRKLLELIRRTGWTP